jgi:hypothetical protein
VPSDPSRTPCSTSTRPCRTPGTGCTSSNDAAKDWNSFFAAAGRSTLDEVGRSRRHWRRPRDRVRDRPAGADRRTPCAGWTSTAARGKLYMRGDTDRRPSVVTKLALYRSLAPRGGDAVIVTTTSRRHRGRKAGFTVMHADWGTDEDTGTPCSTPTGRGPHLKASPWRRCVRTPRPVDDRPWRATALRTIVRRQGGAHQHPAEPASDPAVGKSHSTRSSKTPWSPRSRPRTMPTSRSRPTCTASAARWPQSAGEHRRVCRRYLAPAVLPSRPGARLRRLNLRARWPRVVDTFAVIGLTRPPRHRPAAPGRRRPPRPDDDTAVVAAPLGAARRAGSRRRAGEQLRPEPGGGGAVRDSRTHVGETVAAVERPRVHGWRWSRTRSLSPRGRPG